MLRAWECVETKEFFTKCQETSRENGPGLSVFKFKMPKSKPNHEKSNCDFFYIEKSNWDPLMAEYSQRNEFQKIYNHDKHFVVAVSVPAQSPIDPEESDVTIKLFKYDTFEPVPVESITIKS
jgi:hypothetical protein